MKLDADRWYVKLFGIATEVWQRFAYEEDTWTEMPSKTDLCTFVRTTFVYLPLVVLLHAAFYLAIPYVFIILPISVHGLGVYLSALGTIIACVLIVAAIIGSVVGITFTARRLETVGTKIKAWSAKEDSALHITVAYIKARKGKYCPMIEIVKKEEQQ